MKESTLSPSEKASLSHFAHKLVDRAARASVSSSTVPPQVAANEVLTETGRLQLLLELERRIESIGRELSNTLTAVLVSVERLEDRVARLEGEVEGLYANSDKLEESTRLHKQELSVSAETFASEITSRLTTLLGRIEVSLDPDKRILSEVQDPKSQATVASRQDI